MPDLLTACRDHLVAQAVVRKPSVAGPLPPLWLEPRDGVPAPGEGEKPTEVGNDIVAGAFTAPGIPIRQRHSGFRRIDGMDFWIRTRTAPLVWPFEAALRAALNDKRGWSMAGLQIIESLIFRELQRLASDAQGFTYIVGFTFQRYTD